MTSSEEPDLIRLIFEAQQSRHLIPHSMREITGMAVLKDFVELGGRFNSLPLSDQYTEATLTTQSLGTKALAFFLNNGGRFDPHFRDQHGNSEFIKLLRESSITERPAIITLYAEHDGEFQRGLIAQGGVTEALAIIAYSAPEDVIPLLTIFIENGGEFNPDARHSTGGRNELAFLIDTAGFEGLKFYLDNGGIINPAERGESINSEISKVVHTGIEGLQYYIDHGGYFCKGQDGEWSDAMAVASSLGAEGLQFFVDNGGVFNHEIKSGTNFSEAMVIASLAGAGSLDVFARHGGVFNFANTAKLGDQEVTEGSLIAEAYGGTIPDYIRQRDISSQTPQRPAPPKPF